MSDTAKKLEIDVDWDSVFQKGAESLASSMGTAIGGPLGGAIVGALLGTSGPSAFEQEVLVTLKRIEEKLDAVVKFMNEQLPALVARKVDAGFVKNAIFKLNSKLKSVEGALATVHEAKPNELTEAVLDLQMSGQACLELGYEILQYGKEWYLSGVHAFTAGFSAFAVVIKHRPAQGAKFLKWTKAYEEIMTPWLSDDPLGAEPFPDEDFRLRYEMASARELLAPFAEARQSYLIAVAKILPDQNIYARWNLNILFSGGKIDAQLSAPTNYAFYDGEISAEAFAGVSATWWPTRCVVNYSNERISSIYNRALSKPLNAADFLRINPPRTKAIVDALNSISAMTETFTQIKSAAGNTAMLHAMLQTSIEDNGSAVESLLRQG